MLSALLIVAGLLLLLYGIYLQASQQAQPATDPAAAPVAPVAAPVFRGPVTVYYATQTGTAGAFAKRLAAEAKAQGLIAVVKNISACSLEALQTEGLAVFLVSTHYEGEPTDDMRAFWQAFSKAGQPGALGGLKYSGFALGDLNYKFYCQTGRLLNKKLEALGAERIYTFGEGSNDQGAIDEYFEEWLIPLWAALLPHAPILPEQSARALLAQTDPTNFVVRLSRATAEADPASEAGRSQLDPAAQVGSPHQQYASTLASHIIGIREVRQLASKTESTLHVDIRVPPGAQYETGQNLKVYPENTSENERRALACVGLDPDQMLEFESPGVLPFPSPIRAGALLRKFVDLQGPVKKSQLKRLAELLRGSPASIE